MGVEQRQATHGALHGAPELTLHVCTTLPQAQRSLQHHTIGSGTVGGPHGTVSSVGRPPLQRFGLADIQVVLGDGSQAAAELRVKLPRGEGAAQRGVHEGTHRHFPQVPRLYGTLCHAVHVAQRSVLAAAAPVVAGQRQPVLVVAAMQYVPLPPAEAPPQQLVVRDAHRPRKLATQRRPRVPVAKRRATLALLPVLDGDELVCLLRPARSHVVHPRVHRLGRAVVPEVAGNTPQDGPRVESPPRPRSPALQGSRLAVVAPVEGRLVHGSTAVAAMGGVHTDALERLRHLLRLVADAQHVQHPLRTPLHPGMVRQQRQHDPLDAALAAGLQCVQPLAPPLVLRVQRSPPLPRRPR